jgi:hypothetical protein
VTPAGARARVDELGRLHVYPQSPAPMAVPVILAPAAGRPFVARQGPQYQDEGGIVSEVIKKMFGW